MTIASSGTLIVELKSSSVLLVRLAGNCHEQSEALRVEAVREALDQFPGVKSLSFESTGLTGWNSRFVAFIRNCSELCRKRQVGFQEDGLPDGVRRLLRLAQTVPERKDVQRAAVKSPFLQTVGEGVVKNWAGALAMFTFLGENVLALANLLRGRAQFRWSDAFLVMEQCGPQALGIVALINFLVGLILAFVGAVQLMKFGASIYVADLVGIATVREMGCIMTGIILCGRTGAAFAAQLGTMKVNEEINALQTFGISPIEFLVLPRMIALILVMPFLCAFADLISISGGFVVSVSMLDVTPTEYLTRTIQAIQLPSFLLGIGKGCFFGLLVAYTGCLRGMQSGSSAAAVGEATTKAVVTGITAIVASDGIFAVICNTLGFEAQWMNTAEIKIEIQNLTMAYGSHVVMRDINARVKRGSIFVVMGNSGSGKSTLLQHLIGLQHPAQGDVLYDGRSFWSADDEARRTQLRKCGVLFQSSALWSSMTLAENVALPLVEYTDWSATDRKDVVRLKLALVGLSGFEDYYPAELSGGMRKRAGLARAMALDPEILFFDEPSAGLDPITSRNLDQLILELRDSLGATVVIVTHELASIFMIADDSIFLDADTRTMRAQGNPRELLKHSTDAKLRAFLTRGEMSEEPPRPASQSLL